MTSSWEKKKGKKRGEKRARETGLYLVQARWVVEVPLAATRADGGRGRRYLVPGQWHKDDKGYLDIWRLSWRQQATPSTYFVTSYQRASAFEPTYITCTTTRHEAKYLHAASQPARLMGMPGSGVRRWANEATRQGSPPQPTWRGAQAAQRGGEEPRGGAC